MCSDVPDVCNVHDPIFCFQLIIVKKWGSLNKTERLEIHQTLWNHYCSLAHNVPKIQREKLAHLIALIGKREFPDDGKQRVEHP